MTSLRFLNILQCFANEIDNSLISIVTYRHLNKANQNTNVAQRSTKHRNKKSNKRHKPKMKKNAKNGQK